MKVQLELLVDDFLDGFSVIFGDGLPCFVELCFCGKFFVQRDDQTIKGVKNEDARDLARTARIAASAAEPNCEAASVTNGWTRAINGYENRWIAPLASDGAWLELAWDTPQKISQVQLTFDTGFQRELTLTKQDDFNERMIRAPQPETVKTYFIQYQPEGSAEWINLVTIDSNHQRVRCHDFKTVQAKRIRIHVKETNGDKLARIFEVRCYV